jgi:hypothetical protein
MSGPFQSEIWSSVLADVQSYGVLILAVPPIALLAIKLWLVARAASGKTRQTHYVLAREKDANGIPLLARNDDFGPATRLP